MCKSMRTCPMKLKQLRLKIIRVNSLEVSQFLGTNFVIGIM